MKNLEELSSHLVPQSRLFDVPDDNLNIGQVFYDRWVPCVIQHEEEGSIEETGI